MAWYTPTLATIGVWQRRVAVSVDLTTAAGVNDVDIIIPPDFDDFWERIDASGLELRLVSGDSRTLAAYSVDNGAGGAFDRANRLGRIRVDAFAFGATPGMWVMWLYYGSTTAQGTGAVATVIAASATGWIELGRPNLRKYPYAPVRPGFSRPSTIASKTSGENVDLWLDVSAALEFRSTKSNGGIFHEEVSLAIINVYDSVPADQPAMYDKANTRIVFHQRTGRTWLKVAIQAGANGTNYTVVPTVYTHRPGTALNVLAQKLQPVVALVVRDLIPP